MTKNNKQQAVANLLRDPVTGEKCNLRLAINDAVKSIDYYRSVKSINFNRSYDSDKEQRTWLIKREERRLLSLLTLSIRCEILAR